MNWSSSEVLDAVSFSSEERSVGSVQDGRLEVARFCLPLWEEEPSTLLGIKMEDSQESLRDRKELEVRL